MASRLRSRSSFLRAGACGRVVPTRGGLNTGLRRVVETDRCWYPSRGLGQSATGGFGGGSVFGDDTLHSKYRFLHAARAGMWRPLHRNA